VSTAGDDTDTTVTVRSAFGRRSASATTNKLDDKALAAVVETSERLARLTPEDPEAMPELPPQQYQEAQGWSAPTAALDPAGRRLVAGMGAVLAVMNVCFYISIDRLPLGTVAAIEFLPVILLAAIGVRSRRNGIALVFAVAGVYVLTDVQLAGRPLGVAVARTMPH
jgi:drug/metabolite transporter (DMT)-like permease